MQEVGDYDLRGPDFETILVGPITATIIDADRLIREDWSNGFPNWAMYRCIYAGDEHYATRLREWCVAFAVAYCEAGGLRKYTDELACLAAWDAYHALRNRKWIASGADIAEVAGVDPKTYRKLRGALYASLKASLDEYWIRIQIAYRQVVLMERRQDDAAAPSRYSNGRGFDLGEDMSGSGNFRAMPRGSGT